MISVGLIRILAPYLIGAFVFAAIVTGLFYAGARYQANKAETDAARDYIEGTEETRDAENNVPDDPNALIDWLLRFGSASD